ncbi:MAG: UPF0280 family protein [Candidatus Bathyarchaeia archaeon]
MNNQNLFRETFEFGETRGLIITDEEDAITAAKESLRENRRKLEGYIRRNPKFLYSLKPVKVDNDSPKVAKLMAEASEKAGVGPMAAVAGVLADLAVEAMLAKGARVALVENGGEVSAVSDRPINVALSAGDHPLSKRVGFKLENFPVGIATSSGVYSHAISFGEAEAVTIFAENAGLADAVATAVGNIVIGDNPQKAVENGARKALSVEGVRGTIIIYRGTVGIAGQIPKILKIVPTMVY